MKASEQVKKLTDTLQKLLAEKAGIDEQIVAVRNQIHGVNLGAELQKEIDENAEAAKETPPEE